MRTVIKVSRDREEEAKTGKKSRERSYYVSNEVGKYEQLSKAIRNHWQVETANYIRDCTLKEDKLRSKKDCQSDTGRNQNLGNRYFESNKLSK